MDLTKKQQRIVKLLYGKKDKFSVVPLSTRSITQYLNLDENYRDGLVTISQVRSSLVRLMNRGILVRYGYPARWALSYNARKYLDDKGFKR